MLSRKIKAQWAGVAISDSLKFSILSLILPETNESFALIFMLIFVLIFFLSFPFSRIPKLNAILYFFTPRGKSWARERKRCV